MSSSSDLITKAKNFNATKVSYRDPVTNKRGGKSMQLGYNGKQIVLQIPLMMTWGVNERVDEQTGRVSYDMSLQFDSNKASHVAFLQNVKTLEDKIKDDAVKNATKWFGRKTSREVVDALMYPLLKYPKKKDGSGEYDYSRDPTFKVKIQFWEGVWKCELFNMNREPLYLPPKDATQDFNSGRTPLTSVPSRSWVVGLIACNGMWFAGGKCGVTWKVMQFNVRPPTTIVGSGVCQILEDSDDEEALDDLKKKDADKEFEQQDDEYTQDLGPSFEDSDDNKNDEEEEEEEVVVAPPKPKKKKKVIRKKKN
jgi:hypothetical protein